MSAQYLDEARKRIADCLQLNEQGQLVQRRDYLNLANLEITDDELNARFDPKERGLPEIGVGDLIHLRYLDLTGNELTELPECVTRFKGLVWLGLNFNRIERLPEAIGQLKALKRLYLRGNSLTELPAGIDGLTALEELDCHGNRIAQPPMELLPLLKDGRAAGRLHFDFSDNDSQWIEVVNAAEGAEAQHKALRSYLQQMQLESVVLKQGKLLLVGEGGVGKTTLLDVLEGKPYNNHSDTTHGLELRPLRFTEHDGWAGTLHAWDFSGQPAMRQTHQLFFTTPALYLLVWNHREARESETSDEIAEWLTLIDQRTQGGGRVLLIAKKAKDRTAEPPRYHELMKRFGPESKDGGGVLLPDPCLKVDSEGEQAGQQVEALRRRIAEFANKSPAFNERRPPNWVRAQAHFGDERGRKPYLSWSEFVSACRELKIPDATEYVRAQHRLGTLVWVDTERMRRVEFGMGEEPMQLVVLNPDWLSKAIGFVIERDEKDKRLDDASVPERPGNVPPGLVSVAQMDAIWSSPPQPREGPALVFPKELFPFFRQLMRAFDIARPVKQDGTTDQWYLVPNRLKDRRPTWEESWDESMPQVFWRAELRVKNGDPLNRWLAVAIFYRLMIILHGDAQGRQNFACSAHWRSGFILAPPGGGMARIEFNGSDRQDGGRCIGFDIQVASHQPREIWSIFAQALDFLLRDLERHYGYTDMKVRRLVSCPAKPFCKRDAAQRYFLDEKTVVDRAHSGKEGWRSQTAICGATDCGRDLTIGQLWDGRTADDDETGSLERIERKLDSAAESAKIRHDTMLGVQTAISVKLDRLQSSVATVRRLLESEALKSEAAVRAILNGQERLEEELRTELEQVSEALSAELRGFLLSLADTDTSLPRSYTLSPVEKGGWKVPFTEWHLPSLAPREWRLRLHCEKTGYPAVLFSDGGAGEFTISETSDFLRAVGPYVRRVSRVLVALGPVTALLTTANPIVAVTPAVALTLAQWAHDYQNPIKGLADLLKEELAGGHGGMVTTGQRPVLAEKAGLAWLHQFLRPHREEPERFGLKEKVDGQGRRWWVLPQVEV